MPNPSVPPPAARLLMHDIHKRFGATLALRGVSFQVRAGEVMALIGENGAGKSTLMKILSGAIRPDAGRMEVDGRPYEPHRPQEARSLGVAMIYQELNLAPELTVEDNILLGQERARWGILQRRQQRQLAAEALGQLGHGDLPLDARVGRLPVGLQQLVEIARALVGRATSVIFDEPTSSLPQRDAERLFGVIRRLRDQGLAIVYISHFLEEIRRVADRFTVLRDGQTAGVGHLSEVGDRQVVAMMTGRSVSNLFPKVPHAIGHPVLEVNKLGRDGLPRDVSFQLREGEILGLFGLVGAGRTETLRCLFGLDTADRGSVAVKGRCPAPRPRARIAAGLSLVSEDRKTEGLAQQLSLADNLTLSHLRPYARAGWLLLGRRRRQVCGWIERLGIKAQHPDQPVAGLSGGNQQKVALARILHQNADILLLDEPTRGIDVGTKSEIYRWMGELAVQGKAIVFVSSYLPELLAVCDRLGVVVRGRLVEVRPASDWDEESILACAVGGEPRA